MSERFKYYFASQVIKDNKTGQRYYGNKPLAELLNEQHETIQRLNQNIDELLSVDIEEELLKENEQLKQAYIQLKHRHSLLHDVCIDAECDRDSLKKDVESLEKENEKLKAQLLYDGDGVCNICKHQYLVETGKYYVAKCEKEHEECSKVDLQYCEDFELVRDYE